MRGVETGKLHPYDWIGRHRRRFDRAASRHPIDVHDFHALSALRHGHFVAMAHEQIAAGLVRNPPVPLRGKLRFDPRCPGSRLGLGVECGRTLLCHTSTRYARPPLAKACPSGGALLWHELAWRVAQEEAVGWLMRVPGDVKTAASRCFVVYWDVGWMIEEKSMCRERESNPYGVATGGF